MKNQYYIVVECNVENGCEQWFYKETEKEKAMCKFIEFDCIGFFPVIRIEWKWNEGGKNRYWEYINSQM